MLNCKSENSENDLESVEKYTQEEWEYMQAVKEEKDRIDRKIEKLKKQNERKEADMSRRYPIGTVVSLCGEKGIVDSIINVFSGEEIPPYKEHKQESSYLLDDMRTVYGYDATICVFFPKTGYKYPVPIKALNKLKKIND